MKISEMITDRYKLRIPPTVYYDLLADVQEAEEEQEPFKPMVEIDLYSVIKQKYIEREVLDKIRAEIEQIYQDIDTCSHNEYENAVEQGKEMAYENVLNMIDKYKAEIEPQENEDNK